MALPAKKANNQFPTDNSQLEHVKRNTAKPAVVTANTVAIDIMMTRGSEVFSSTLFGDFLEEIRGQSGIR